MHVDSYQFGKIVIDGVEYTNDVLVIANTVQPDWWRKKGHMLSPEDLRPIVDAAPSILVVGCGAYGVMNVPEQTRQFLADHNIQIEALNTHKAVEKFNELARAGKNIAAALHLTC